MEGALKDQSHWVILYHEDLETYFGDKEVIGVLGMTRTLVEKWKGKWNSRNRRQIGSVERGLKQVCDELGGADDVGCVLCKG